MAEKNKNAFKIKKSNLVGLANWLSKQELDGRRSRERTRFIKKLTDAIKTLEAERLEIIGKYVEKEKDEKTGKEVFKTETVDNSTNYDFQEDKKLQAEKEIDELYSEDFVVAITEENKDNMACIKDIVLNTKYVFGCSDNVPLPLQQTKIREATEYNVWCESFERVL